MTTKTRKESIQVESNDAVQERGPGPVESTIDTSHPVGIVVETFVGVQRNVNWAEKGQ